MKLFNRPKACVPFAGKNLQELKKEVDAFKQLISEVDTTVHIEWRADYLEDFNMISDAAALLHRELQNVPKIFTLRTDVEGGYCSLKTKDRLDIIRRYVAGFEYCDVEAFACQEGELAGKLADMAREKNCKIILSHHDFGGTPSLPVIEKVLRQLAASARLINAYAIKVAYTPKSEKDVMNLLNASFDFRADNTDLGIVVVSMGDLGVASRVFPLSMFSYGFLFSSSAAGQIPIRQLIATLKVFPD